MSPPGYSEAMNTNRTAPAAPALLDLFGPRATRVLVRWTVYDNRDAACGSCGRWMTPDAARLATAPGDDGYMDETFPWVEQVERAPGGDALVAAWAKRNAYPAIAIDAAPAVLDDDDLPF